MPLIKDEEILDYLINIEKFTFQSKDIPKLESILDKAKACWQYNSGLFKLGMKDVSIVNKDKKKNMIGTLLPFILVGLDLDDIYLSNHGLSCPAGAEYLKARIYQTYPGIIREIHAIVEILKLKPEWRITKYIEKDLNSGVDFVILTSKDHNAIWEGKIQEVAVKHVTNNTKFDNKKFPKEANSHILWATSKTKLGEINCISKKDIESLVKKLC